MASKRPRLAVHASPARMPALRSRKRQKVGSSMRTARSFNPDRIDDDDANDTDSDWEDQMEHERAESSARGGAAVDRTRRASAPSGSSRGAMATRRSSLPQRRGHAETSQRTRAADPRARGPRGGKEDSGITQQPRTTRTGRTQHPLSPLPVNHSVERSYFPATNGVGKGKGKERAVEEDVVMPPPRRRRDVSVPAQAARVTRRTSGGYVAPASPGEQNRTTRRRSRSIVEDDDEFEDEEMAVEGSPRRRLRSDSRTSLETISDAGETADGEGDEENVTIEEEGDGGRASDDDGTFHSSFRRNFQ